MHCCSPRAVGAAGAPLQRIQAQPDQREKRRGVVVSSESVAYIPQPNGAETEGYLWVTDMLPLMGQRLCIGMLQTEMVRLAE